MPPFTFSRPSLLTLIATPIGNLEDISPRALKALNESDAILCEDTRHSAILLNRYGIKKPLHSYHKFKEKKALEPILEELRSGKRLALISDAGTPCISDPGGYLAEKCVKEGIPIVSIPGPCSVIQALVLAAMPIDRFQFLGFLPKSPLSMLKQSLFYPGLTVAFESPHRLVKTLKIIETLSPNRPLAIAREMTKTFEECRRGIAFELRSHFQTEPPKGEIVLVIGEGSPPEEALSSEECIDMLRNLHGLSLKEAIKESARLLKIPKTEVYKEFHKKENMQ